MIIQNIRQKKKSLLLWLKSIQKCLIEGRKDGDFVGEEEGRQLKESGVGERGGER